MGSNTAFTGSMSNTYAKDAASPGDANALALIQMLRKNAHTALLANCILGAAVTYVMRGAVEDVLLAVVTAMIGVWLFSVGLMGYYVRPLGWAVRLCFLAAGLSTLLPAEAFEGALFINIVGAGFGAILVLKERAFKRHALLNRTEEDR